MDVLRYRLIWHGLPPVYLGVNASSQRRGSRKFHEAMRVWPGSVTATQQGPPHLAEISIETLRKLQRSAYWRFYLKPRPILNLGRKLTNWRNVKKISRAIHRRMTESTISSLN